MSSASKNRIVRADGEKRVFPTAEGLVAATTTYDQGDLLIFDDSLNHIRKPTLETEGNTFIGVSVQSVVLGIPKSPYVTDVDASAAAIALAAPSYGVVARLVAKTGAAFNPGDLVFLDPATGAAGVTSAGTKAIGIYIGSLVIAVATAGQEIECRIGARHPQDVLKM